MSGLSEQYPNDVGIELDPNVIFVEKFDEPTLAEVGVKWGDFRFNTASFSNDIPKNFPQNARSLQCPRLVGDNGVSLYHRITGREELFVRYYIKYDTFGPPSHSGVWMGGYEPPSNWPQGLGGTKPNGSDFFTAAFEQSRLTQRADHYDYWMGMHPDGNGAYWGNTLLNNPQVKINLNEWTCIEHSIKLNKPVTSLNGEHSVWINGKLVSSLGLQFPNGTWSGSNFTQNPAVPNKFEGFRWRNTMSLDIDWVWLQAYVDGGDPNIQTTTWFAHVVVATKYIGPLVPKKKKYKFAMVGEMELEEIE